MEGDEYISAKVVDKSVWSKHRHVKICVLMFLGKPFVVLIFVCSISEGNFHHLKTLQIIADMLRIIFSITRASVSECGRLLAL